MLSAVAGAEVLWLCVGSLACSWDASSGAGLILSASLGDMVWSMVSSGPPRVPVKSGFAFCPLGNVTRDPASEFSCV